MAAINTERVQFEEALAHLLSSYSSSTSTVSISDTRLSLINYTKAKLDELIPEGEGIQFSMEDDINISDPLNLLVNAVIDEAAKRILLTAPLHVLDPVKSEAVAVADADDDKTGYIPLADNFLRLVSLKMKDWQREVTEVITPQDKRYKLQTNKFTRGGLAKPVIVFSRRTIDGEAQRVLEYFSVDSAHDIDWFYYIQDTYAENLQSNLMDSLTWMCASIVLQITERPDLAKLALDQVSISYQNF